MTLRFVFFHRGIKPEDIKEIDLEVYYLAVDITDRPAPRNHLEAVVSIQHGFSVGLLKGQAGLKEYADEVVLDERILETRKKIRVRKNPDMQSDQCRANVTLNNGEVLTEYVEHNLGSNAMPLSDKAIEDKFKMLTADYLSPEKQQRLIDYVWDFDKLDGVEEFVKCCISDRYEE